MLAYGAVVCHLYKVVEFGAFTDGGATHYGTVYTRIGTDLYVICQDYIPQLGDFLVPLLGGRKAEPISPDYGTCV